MQTIEENFSVSLSYNDKTVELPFGKMSSFDELYVDFNVEKQEKYLRIRLTIHPKESIILHDLALRKTKNYRIHERIFCNGFQSWSESKEYELSERIPKLKPFLTSKFNLQGDNNIKGISRTKGHFHSWTYSYIRSNEDFDFVGSLNENNAFTIIQHDTQNHLLSIQKDCENLQLNHSFPILDIVLIKGKEKQVFDQYFNLMNIEVPSKNKITGWSSWYNYFDNISEEIVMQNVTAFADRKTSIDIIQIDDGYQKKVGDWQSIKPSFQKGMGKISKKIKERGFKVGIWIAPFICEENSDLFKNRPNWIIKDAKGKPLKIGYNSVWKSWFYALDFYNQEVQKHLTSVFFTITEKWHFDLVKLDFLYAVCLNPPSNKTRGQVMSDAVSFLQNLLKRQMILACGVPLGSVFGKVDYCRVGPDVHMQWEDKKLKWLGHRERTSTFASLQSTIGRWQLNNRAFNNDPDVFILRDSNNKLSFNQKHTLLTINTLLGNILFTSDGVHEYSEEQWSEFDSIFKWRNSEINSVKNPRKNQYLIHFKNDNLSWLALCNLGSKIEIFQLKKGQMILEPFETIILKNN